MELRYVMPRNSTTMIQRKKKKTNHAQHQFSSQGEQHLNSTTDWNEGHTRDHQKEKIWAGYFPRPGVNR